MLRGRARRAGRTPATARGKSQSPHGSVRRTRPCPELWIRDTGSAGPTFDAWVREWWSSAPASADWASPTPCARPASPTSRSSSAPTTVGGVWRDNTYPGAACDVPSPLYSWSWATNPGWGRRYSGAAGDPRLHPAHRRGRRAARPGPHRHRRSPALGTSDGALAGHHRRPATLRRRPGRLRPSASSSNPVVPAIPGADTFAGPAFHSAQWRHDVDLTGKRVAVVGTGASAIQFVPGIVDEVGSMTVFQRSAPYVVPEAGPRLHRAHHRLFETLPGGARRRAAATYWLTEQFNGALEGTSPLTRPLMATIRAVVAAAPAPPGPRPRAAPPAGAGLPARLQAAAVLQRLVPRARPRPRRRRRPSGSPRSSRPACAPPTAGCTRPTC